jgi:DNA-3-methyladenine glycosylase I
LLKYREAFEGFDPNIVAKMGEKEIMEIASNKAIMLAESRVRCIVDNSKCILKASLEN